MTETTFTEDDISNYGTLGPAYPAANRWAEKVIEQYQAEHLEPLVKLISDSVTDKLWDLVRDYLLADTEANAADAVRDMVDQTIEALLNGKEWAMQRYPFADYSRGEDIRREVAKHGGETLLTRRIADLEAELAKAKETIKWLHR